MTGRLREWWERFLELVGRRRADHDLDAELQAHIDLAVDDHLRRGLPLEAARRLAATQVGSRLLAKDHVADQQSWSQMESMVADARFAARILRKNLGFTTLAVAILALGIGVNAAVFTVTKAAFFAGFPHVDRNDRLVYITDRGYIGVSYPDFEDWRARATSFGGLALVHGIQRTMSDQRGFAESYDATEVTPNTFTLVGQRPILGRDFTPADAQPGADPVAILHYGFWERRYGKNPDVLGRIVRINGAPTTVIGIMPEGFSFPQKQDLWVPLIPTPDVLRRDNRDTWFAFGRLADGVTIQRARAELQSIGERLARDHPLTNKDVAPHVQTFRQFFIFPNEDVIYASMWGAVACVLLIACANLANLLLARALGRSREMFIRIALGAGRWRIMRQLLIESLMLSGLGALFGWWLATWAVRAYALADRGPGRTSWRILDFSMDYRVLGYVIAIAMGTALVFGLAPALRLSTLDVNTDLKDGGRSATGGGPGTYLSTVLIVVEMAVAVVLLAGAGVMIRSFFKVYHADPGVSTADILTTAITLPAATYANADAWGSFYDRVTAQLEAIPGVDAVALTARLPTDGSRRLSYELAGAPPINDQRRPTLSSLTIGPRYFQTLRAPVLAGREFTDADGMSGLPVVIVNQQFATRHWAGEDPLGKRLRLWTGETPGEWLTVVGVVTNIVQDDRARQAFDPLVYMPYKQAPVKGMTVMARTRVPAERLSAAFREAVQTLDPDLPMFGPFSLARRLEGTYWSRGLYGGLFLIFAAIALVLASIGQYAVIAHSVSRRTQEIGIRLTIGATARDILALIVGRGMFPIGVGLIIGLTASLGVNRILQSQLVQVSPADPLTLVTVSVVLVVAATLGCWIPAHRATAVDPLVALRHE